MVVVVVVLISVIGLTVVSIEKVEDRTEYECREACERLGYDFLRTEYEGGYLSKIECYALDDEGRVVKILY